MRTWFLPLIMLLLLPQSTNADVEQVTLRLNLESGETYWVKLLMEQQIEQQIDGTAQNMQQTLGFTYSNHVTAVAPDGTMQLRVRYERVIFKQKSNLAEIDYDSDAPPDVVPMLARGFAALPGCELILSITPTGYVRDLQGVDQLLARMIERLDLPDGPLKTQVRENLKQQFGTQALKESFQQMLGFYPRQPVAIGEAWSEKWELQIGMPITLDNTWRLKSLSPQTATLAVTSQITTNDDRPMEMGPLKVACDLAGDATGTTVLNRQTGWLIESRLEQRMRGTLTPQTPGTPAPTTAPTWPISVRTKLTFESMDPEDNEKTHGG